MPGSKRNYKILFILPSLASGGAERVLITLANGADRMVFDPVFINIRGKGPLFDLIDPEITYEELEKKSVISAIVPLYAVFKRHQPDIVISTLPHMNFAVLVLKPFFSKTKFIVREAITPSYLLDKYGPASLLIKILYKTLFPKADVILSPSRKILDELGEFLKCDRQKFKVLPNPVDAQKYRAGGGFQKIDEARKKTVNFIACGRLVRQKGFDLLIDAAAKLDLPYDWKINILGEGPERASLEQQIAAHHLQDKIMLSGLVSDPYVHFAQADCFLLPSRYEGLPNVVLESLSCGAPVIATAQSGGIAEIAAHTQGDALKICENMDEFLSEMKKIKPNPTVEYRPSLLPEIYKKENILRRFNDLLKETLKPV